MNFSNVNLIYDMRNITVNGRLASDVTRQLSKSGTEFLNFSIANTEFGDPKSSDGKLQTQWFRVVSFQPQHMALAPHLKKGKPIVVTGKYSNRLYQSQKTGQWGISNDIIALDIAFEIGSERQETATTTTSTVSPTQVVEQVITAVEEIPQATSRQMTAPPTQVTPQTTSNVFGNNVGDDDDLPF